MRSRHPGVDATRTDRGRLQRRTLSVLTAAQILGAVASGAGASVSPLLAEDILGDGSFAGLAFAALSFGGALSALPLSRTMGRHGRRPGLVAGYAIASAGAAGAAVAAEVRSFPLLLVGMVLLGVGGAAGSLARYAGADLAEPSRRARGIATVVWAATVGAVAGPNLVGPAGRVAEAMGVPRLAGPYVVASLSLAIAAVVVWAFLRPDPLAAAGILGPAPGPASRSPVARQLRSALRDRGAVAALVTMTTAHGVMVAIMTMTPLQLRGNGHPLEVVGLVFSLHVVGLYGLAPVIGAAADRLGHLRVARGGALLLVVAAVLAAGAGADVAVVAVALTLLGLGWSMATIGGATALTATLPVRDRAPVQGAADMAMGFVAGVGGTLAGIVVGVVGFRALSLLGALAAAALLGVPAGSPSGGTEPVDPEARDRRRMPVVGTPAVAAAGTEA